MQNMYLTKDLYPNYVKNLQLNKKTTQNITKYSRYFTEEGIGMDSKPMKRCSPSLVVSEVKVAQSCLTLWWITRTWKILEEMGIPRPPFLSPEEPGQEATIRTVHGTMYMFEGV